LDNLGRTGGGGSNKAGVDIFKNSTKLVLSLLLDLLDIGIELLIFFLLNCNEIFSLNVQFPLLVLSLS